MEKIISHHLMNPSNDGFLTWTFATERLKIARMSSDRHAMRPQKWNHQQESFLQRSDETS